MKFKFVRIGAKGLGKSLLKRRHYREGDSRYQEREKKRQSELAQRRENSASNPPGGEDE